MTEPVSTPETTPVVEKRGVGRPPKPSEQSEKKGNPTWRPANAVRVTNKEPGYTYRLIEKSPENVDKKVREGWEVLNGTNAKGESNPDGYGRIEHGKQLTSALEGHDYVVGRIPNEMAEARKEYYADKTRRLEQALVREAKNDMSKATGGKGIVHGGITIEKRGTKTVIE